MKPRNNRHLMVIPVLIRISSHDPPPTQASEWLNHITMRRVEEIRVNVWLIRLPAAKDPAPVLDEKRRYNGYREAAG